MKRPRELSEQAADVAAVARLAADFFLGKAAAAEVRPARLRSQRSFKTSHAALKGDWLALARRLEDAAELLWRAVEESARLEASDKGFAPMARELAEALRTIEAGGGVDAILEAKKRAMEIERMHRGVRKSSQDDPRFVVGLKTGAVGLRLSDAAEAVQRACDILAEMLGAQP